MLNFFRKSAYLVLLSGSIMLVPSAHAGSTIGGNPSNGGGVTFGVPIPQLLVDDDRRLEEALATGDPALISAALLNALAIGITVTLPGGSTFLLSNATDLSPFPDQTGEATVQALTVLVLQLAVFLGLSPTDPAILRLLEIADTAET